MPSQQQIDFSRAEQLAILRDCQLPKGLGVAPSTLKLVLKIMDDYGRGRESFMAIPRLARDCNVGEKQVGRAIAILKERSLLLVELKKSELGTVVNHYRIVWSELMLLRKERTTRSEPSGSDRTFQPDRKDICDRAIGHFGGSDGTFRADRKVICEGQGHPIGEKIERINASKRTLNASNRESAVVIERIEVSEERQWDHLCDELQAEGLASSVAREARLQGMPLKQLDAILCDYRANRTRLLGAGALAHRIREGVWPVPGIISAAEKIRQEDEHLAKRLQQMRDVRFKEIVQTGRRNKLDATTIREQLLAELPADFIKQKNW